MLVEFYRGREVLGRALEYAGGADALRDLRFVWIESTGTFTNEMQSFRPPGLGPSRSFALRLDLIVDHANDRYRQNARRVLEDGWAIPIHAVVRGTDRITLLEAVEQYFTGTGTAADILFLTRLYLPSSILAKAADQIGSTRWVGDTVLRGERVDILDVSWDARTRYRLYIGRDVPAVRRLAYLFPDQFEGDVAATIDYVGEQEVGGLRVPGGIRATRRGPEPWLDMRLTRVQFAPSPDTAGLFEIPSNYSRIIHHDGPHTTEVAPGVYDIGDISGSTYRTPVVEFDDFLLVFDAPLHPGIGRRVIDEIRRSISSKPIRHLVISHFHEDHIGGVRPFVEAGVTVTTVPDAVDPLQATVAAHSRLAGLPPDPQDVTVVPQLVDDSLVVASGGRRAVIRRFAPSIPHVAQLLIVDIPDAEVVLAADLYGPGVEWNPTYEAFLSWLRSSGRAEWTVLGVHHGPATAADIAETRRFDLPRRRDVQSR